jgi:hypothetical protein
MTSNETLQQFIDELAQWAADHTLQGQYPNALAAAMASQAIRMYRTMFSDEEFETIMAALYASKDTVRPYEIPSLN